MKVRGVYCIRNTSNGRLYVGSSSDVGRRLYVHRRLLNAGDHHSVALQRAWDKYGAAAFEFSILCEVAAGTDLLKVEQEHIDKHGAAGAGGYNMCPAAGSREGSKQPEGFAGLMAAIHRGKPKSAETRARMSAAAKGRVKSHEHCAKLAEAGRRQMGDPAARAHLSAVNTGRKHTDETKRKIGESSAGRLIPQHVRNACAESNRQRVWTDEMRAKAAASKLGNKASDETRERMSAAKSGKPNPSASRPKTEEWKRAHAGRIGHCANRLPHRQLPLRRAQRSAPFDQPGNPSHEPSQSVPAVDGAHAGARRQWYVRFRQRLHDRHR
jgi:group I intron endonuclease